MMSRQLKSLKLALIAFVSVLCTACGIIYEQDVQQGNVITDEMLDKLELGMSKTEVQYYIGTSLIEDPFHSNRWDYFYAYHEGGNKERQQRVITILFDDFDQLVDITGSVETTDARARAVSLPDDGELNTVISDTAQDDESFWQSIKRRVLGSN